MIFNLDDSETKKIVSLFAQHEKNLDYLLYLQGIIWQKACKSPLTKDLDNPYKKRDFLFENLEKVRSFPNDFVKKNIKWDTKLLNADDFLTNPYIKKLSTISFDKDDWSLTQKRIEAYALFPYEEEYHYASNYLLKMSLAFFDKEYIYPSISLF